MVGDLNTERTSHHMDTYPMREDKEVMNIHKDKSISDLSG